MMPEKSQGSAEKNDHTLEEFRAFEVQTLEGFADARKEDATVTLNSFWNKTGVYDTCKRKFGNCRPANTTYDLIADAAYLVDAEI